MRGPKKTEVLESFLEKKDGADGYSEPKSISCNCTCKIDGRKCNSNLK